jgi:calcium-dependent protein kinase
MHVQGIAHRDIKPEKIMVTDEDELKLIGFKYSEKKKPGKQMSNIIGTPYFMAPEVLDGEYDT